MPDRIFIILCNITKLKGGRWPFYDWCNIAVVPSELRRALAKLRTDGIEGCRINDGRVLPEDAKGPVDLCSARTEVERRMVDSRKVKVDFSLEDMDLSEFKGKATYE